MRSKPATRPNHLGDHLNGVARRVETKGYYGQQKSASLEDHEFESRLPPVQAPSSVLKHSTKTIENKAPPREVLYDR